MVQKRGGMSEIGVRMKQHNTSRFNEFRFNYFKPGKIKKAVFFFPWLRLSGKMPLLALHCTHCKKLFVLCGFVQKGSLGSIASTDAFPNPSGSAAVPILSAVPNDLGLAGANLPSPFAGPNLATRQLPPHSPAMDHHRHMLELQEQVLQQAQKPLQEPAQEQVQEQVQQKMMQQLAHTLAET